MPINPDATLIPDKAEVWIALKADVANIDDLIPATPDDDLAALGWEHSGLVDDKKGIPLDPSIEVKEYDAFGHPNFRVKLRKGKLKSGFTVFEINAVTRKFVLPGSTGKRIGIPKDVQIYVLYRFVDEDRSTVWVSLTPAAVEVKSHGGVVEGELSFAECVVHHTANADSDVFEVVDGSSDDVVKTFTIPGGVTAYTVTAGADTTTSITAKTKAALQSALRALPSVQALPTPGVTVEGPDGGPLVATFTGPISPVSAAGTGGTVVVS
ncbi:hypothetical protein C5U48_12950 [Mycolicibacter virginiensis]|uniref:Uncharacterized protein n=1 Tax=Mycolicibacter virginiensis TaxID=1795032 RepID=A0A9X7IME2_9MYCO|nr:hypothetical protein [Mycolicibacter virginiensis]PQM51827.1 hypothetical protein C5U48_12950 [Mycolicibacter virginiensis]